LWWNPLSQYSAPLTGSFTGGVAFLTAVPVVFTKMVSKVLQQLHGKDTLIISSSLLETTVSSITSTVGVILPVPRTFYFIIDLLLLRSRTTAGRH
jgi:hypothetical protein